MPFWDRFVLWVYLGLAETLPVGRDAAARTFALAHRRGRLVPALLNNLSILLLLATCPANSPLWTAAEQEAIRRNLIRRVNHVWRLLQIVRPSRLTELLEIGRPQVPVLRAVVLNVLSDPLLAETQGSLCTFLGRLFLVAPETTQAQALSFLMQATTHYYRIPQGIFDYPARLYRHVLLHLRHPSEALPSALPPGTPPAWFAALEPDEQQVLQRGIDWLSEPDLMLLALHFHAHLTADQIATVLRQEEPAWTADRVVRRLEQCWQIVL